MRSAIYRGRLEHVRHWPRQHRLAHRVTFAFLDVDELPHVLDGRLARRGLMYFRRSDHLRPTDRPLRTAVLEAVERELGARPIGPIGLLTQLRTLGCGFNPVSFYFCYDPTGADVDCVLAEVTNTPWRERHVYAMPCSPGDGPGAVIEHVFPKVFHVSPFMPMDQQYTWSSTRPDEGLSITLRVSQGERAVLDAGLHLQRGPLDASTLRRSLLADPLGPWRVLALIFGHALVLRAKGLRPFPHPQREAS